MFDHITVVDLDDIGQLAELMLFYDKVTLILDKPRLFELCKLAPAEILVPFLEEHRDSIKLRSIASWWKFSFGGKDDFRSIDYRLNPVEGDITDFGGKADYTIDRSLRTRLVNLIYNESFEKEVKDFNVLFEDANIGQEIADYILKSVPIKVPEDLTITIQPSPYIRDENNVGFHSSSTLSRSTAIWIADYARFYISVLHKLSRCAKFDSEILVNQDGSIIVQSKFNDIVSSRLKSANTIDCFQNIFFPEARTIREVVNNNLEARKQFLTVYEKGREFRTWLREKPASVDLLREYYQSTIKDSWIERLPTKVARWALFTGAGVVLDALGAGGVGTIAGVGLGAFDTFLLDRIIEGWKPNQFVDREMKRILKTR